MDSTKRFYQLLKEQFSPLLRAEGFKGSGQSFYRIVGDAIHVIGIQGSRHGGECCVNFGMHYSFLPMPHGADKSQLQKIKEYECIFRDRLHESDVTDQWWRYGETKSESEANVASLIDVYLRRGAIFFQKFEPFPDVFETITPSEIDAGSHPKFSGILGVFQAALAMARIMHHLKRFDQCRQFAEVGLRHIGRAEMYRAELEKLRGFN